MKMYSRIIHALSIYLNCGRVNSTFDGLHWKRTSSGQHAAWPSMFENANFNEAFQLKHRASPSFQQFLNLIFF